MQTMSEAMRSIRAVFESEAIPGLFSKVSPERVHKLASALESYIGTNLPLTIDSRSDLADYRTNPYVLMAVGSAMQLDEPDDFARFIVNTKLYMGLETSFGKAVERIVMEMYPVDATAGEFWEDPAEKLAEFAALEGLSRSEKAKARNKSVWREVDKSCVYKGVRYLVSVKSGPNTINDTQVAGMKGAIQAHYNQWLAESQEHYSIERLDVVLGLTYGTPKTTNHKDVQIIEKLEDNGFREESREKAPGVLVDDATGKVRVYRTIGSGFWSFVANPSDPASAEYAFLEVLVALAIALRKVNEKRNAEGKSDIEERLNARLRMLSLAIAKLQFPRGALPVWVRDDLQEKELFWRASAMTAFYDEGI